ncbi:alanine racemase [Mesobacillus campisalis]|uniref:alanine racemase n=1 Tax=Mesobacillus campisalis TaxID=1408103 RepID=UPI000ACC10A7
MDEKGLFYRDTWAEVDLDSIESNVRRIRTLLPEKVDIIAVVKANAYGHGDIKIANAAIRAGATMLAVAFLDEGLSLRRKGVSVPILVLGASRAEDVNVAANENITLTVFQESWIEQAAAVLLPGKELSLHIKVDSGMGRLGVRSEEELQSMEARLKDDPRFRLTGMFTHFATADELDGHYFQKQQARFEKMISVLTTKPACIHTSNSAAALRYPGAYFSAVRLGIAMYGLAPSFEIKPSLPVELTEAFSLHSRLTQVKKLQKGDKVSYGATYEAASDEWIGTMPIGYADGWLRRLQGQEVLINGIRVPIVGRICMDQCMVRLPGEVPVGSAVTLIGKQQEERISIDEIAAKLETINYEVPCLISSRVPRVYKKDGKIVALNNPILKGDCPS